MKTTRRRLSVALAAVLAAATLACTPREEKKAAPGDAEEVAKDQEALDDLRSAGSDLTKPHRFDFYLYLPSELEAQAAESQLRSGGYDVTVRVGPDNINWLCLASRTMMPTIQEVTEAHVAFKGLAQRYKGVYDGWQAAIEH